MAEAVRVKNIGLRGVTVADTKVSYIDGKNGILIYRGYRIDELAEHSTFEETAYLLLHDALPTERQIDEFIERLVEARQVPDFLFESMKKWPAEAKPMDVLQASIPLLATADPDLEDDSKNANYSKAVRLIARIPVVVISGDGNVVAFESTSTNLSPLETSTVDEFALSPGASTVTV